MSAPELSRPVRIDMLGQAPRTIDIETSAVERDALAARFGFASLSSLSAEVVLERRLGGVVARGTVRAALAQSCVVSGDPVEEQVEAPFEVEFRPHPEHDAEEEIELGEGDLDVIFYDGASVDVGEAVAETLSLSVEPFPRSPAAEEALREAGVKSEEEARAESSPFAALKGKLGK
ncbi:MAG TPA: DUF177 domain-containing protein [Allosphingosinicella sp.]|jgi:uncharacterized metal-binding protein YceD (DUF177 family)